MSKIIYYFLYFIILTALSNCGSHILVTPGNCPGDGQWKVKKIDYKENPEESYFKAQKKVKTPWGRFEREEITLENILGKNNIDCDSIQTMSLTIKSTVGDVFSGLLPFTSQRTVVLSGVKIDPDLETETYEGNNIDNTDRAIKDEDGWAMEW